MFVSKYHYKLRKKTKGVTLIELLVVITIMMTMMSLVAPLAVDTVDKAEAQSEYLSFCSLLRRISVKAFANGAGMTVELKDNTLKVASIPSNLFLDEQFQDSPDEYIFEYTYKYLNFDEVKLLVNRNGMPSRESIFLTQRDKTRELDLIGLLDN